MQKSDLKSLQFEMAQNETLYLSKAVIRKIGNFIPALLLRVLIMIQTRKDSHFGGRDEDIDEGWVFLSYDDLKGEVYFSDKELKSAIKTLKNKGLLEEDTVNGAFRIDHSKYLGLLEL